MSDVQDTLAEVADDWDFPVTEGRVLMAPHPKPAPPVPPSGPPASAVLEDQDEDDMPLTPQPSAVPAAVTPRIVPRATKASPTAEEYQSWSTIQDASEWAGFKERDMEILLSLLAKLDLQPDVFRLIYILKIEPKVCLKQGLLYK